MTSPSSIRAPKARRHALAGNGLIVNRARRALHFVAKQFGEITGASQTEVRVRTSDGIDLTLSYNPGNYVFSRVYNLTITAVLPDDSTAPSAVKVSFKGRDGAHYVRKDGAQGSAALRSLNDRVRPLLADIDVYASDITKAGGVRRITVIPFGGSFVWVLIPPVFKATTFPQGEPERILGLIREVRSLGVEPEDP